MKLKINNNWKEVSSNSILELLLEIGQKQTDGIAVAIDNTVVPKSAWNAHSLKDNQEIIIITATAGG